MIFISIILAIVTTCTSVRGFKMSFTIKFSHRDLLRIVPAFLLCAFGIVLSVLYGFYDSIFWYAGLFILSFVTVTVKSDGSGHKLIRLLPDIIYPVLAAFFSVFFMQMINLAGHENTDGARWLYPFMYNDEPFRWVKEILIIIAFYFFLRMLCITRRFAAGFAPLPFMILGLVDYYVYSFRGHEVLFSDFLSWRTAANVAGAYSFPLLYPLAFIAAPYALYFIACLRLKNDRPVVKPWIRIVIFAVLTAGFLSCFAVSVYKWGEVNRPQDWNDNGSRINGFMLNFSLSVRTMFVSAPENYSTQALDDMVNQTGIDLSDTGSADDDSSNIIVIMNESFMDPRTYLYALGCYDDPTPYFNSLSDNTIHGYAASSVYGGNTPNSEFEFLTGITTGYMPNGAIPYIQYMKGQQYSLAWALKKLGYYTIAMHPYDSSGWNRTKVYPYLGFDKMMFIDDFDYDQSDLQRAGYMTDSQAYKNLITQLQQVPDGKKVFAFLVTIQNHGGYSKDLTNFETTNYVTQTYTGSDLSVNVYLSCLQESDNALRELLEYLSTQDEKYTVLMFGDHQPQLMKVFHNSFALGTNTSWTIPYIIWTNFDMNKDLQQQYEDDTVGITSINYLSLDVLKAAGVKLPAYYQLLSQIRKEVPCINSAGFYSTISGKFVNFEDATAADAPKILELYRFLQYDLVFDNNNSNFENQISSVIGN